MSSRSSLFGEHGRTVVNGGGREKSRSHSYRSSGNSNSDSSRSCGHSYHLCSSHSHSSASSYCSGASFASSHSVSPSSSVLDAAGLLSTANGHCVRYQTPNEYLGRDFGDMSMDELNRKYARISGFGSFISLAAHTSMAQTSRRITQYRVDDFEPTVTRHGSTRGRVSAFDQLVEELERRRREGHSRR
ncbi:hypothetical protein K458DRAFT_396376 [Lentithecium fluviatile CBS 122367]|uniref:Uncharacterized protein n=1 Tax=Lentithecium fluviatile CBS 122367 TaxID=1168545 RepID=A0A6G1IFY9_9PLEO|nr:hypothetical protein K458DRAFT_396376 [Lentithecium fluviatile CBS 122367]